MGIDQSYFVLLHMTEKSSLAPRVFSRALRFGETAWRPKVPQGIVGPRTGREDNGVSALPEYDEWLFQLITHGELLKHSSRGRARSSFL